MNKAERKGSVSLRAFLGAILGAAACAAAVFVARSDERQLPDIRYKPWFVERPKDNPLVVKPDFPREFIDRYRDIELELDVVLDDGAELDVVFHWVHAWKPPKGVAALAPFHDRFSILRLSTIEKGKPFRTREEALFGDGVAGGVKVTAGQPSTVLLQTKGNRFRANVAGTDIPWQDSRDDHGIIALVARGGSATVRSFRIKPSPFPGKLRPPGWGALFGAGLGLLLGLWRSGRSAPLLAIASVLLGGVAARWLFPFEAYLVGVEASLASTLCAALCGVPLAALFCFTRGAAGRLVALLAGVVLGLGCLEAACRIDRPLLRAFEDPRFDFYFGKESGGLPFDALAQRVDRAFRVSTWRKDGYDVVFLGPRQMFDVEDPAKNLTRHVEGRLISELGRPVACTTTSTLTSHALQQFLLFRDFYLDYRPKVIVLGIDAGEDDEEFTESGRELRKRFEGLQEGERPSWPSSGSLLLDLNAREGQQRVPIAAEGDLEATLGEVDAFCKQEGIGLVLAIDASLPPVREQAVRRVAKKLGATVVGGFDMWQMVYPTEELALILKTRLK